MSMCGLREATSATSAMVQGNSSFAYACEHRLSVAIGAADLFHDAVQDMPHRKACVWGCKVQFSCSTVQVLRALTVLGLGEFALVRGFYWFLQYLNEV